MAINEVPLKNSNNYQTYDVDLIDGFRPYKIDEDGDITYIMYYDDTDFDQKIIRITLSGTETTFEASVGKWADRGSLTYRPING
jgi:hypothetical protein